MSWVLSVVLTFLLTAGEFSLETFEMPVVPICSGWQCQKRYLFQYMLLGHRDPNY